MDSFKYFKNKMRLRSRIVHWQYKIGISMTATNIENISTYFPNTFRGFSKNIGLESTRLLGRNICAVGGDQIVGGGAREEGRGVGMSPPTAMHFGSLQQR